MSNESQSKTMACPDCGGTVSKRAASCPHCGAPIAAGEASVPASWDAVSTTGSEDQAAVAPLAQSDPYQGAEQIPANAEKPLEMGNMTFALENLGDGEAVLHAGRFHQIIIWAAYVGLLPAFTLLIYFGWWIHEECAVYDVWLKEEFSGFTDPVNCFLFLAGSILIGLCWWVWRCYCYNRIYKSEFVLTNKRLLTRWGFLFTVVREIQLEQIESVHYGQALLEPWLGVGRLTVRGTGGGKIGKFKYLLDALEFRSRFLAQIDKVSG
jgi:hypothetical protein